MQESTVIGCGEGISGFASADLWKNELDFRRVQISNFPTAVLGCIEADFSDSTLIDTHCIEMTEALDEIDVLSELNKFEHLW